MTKTQRIRSIPTLAGLLGLLLFSTGARTSQAAFITYVTPSGATTSGGAVNATATFDTTSTPGSLLITLTDLQANPTDVAQTISDLSFTLSGGNLTGATSNSLTATVNLITVNDDGTVTSNGTGPAGYVFTSTTTTGTLDVLNGTGHAGPANEIIGPPGAGGTYTAANGSIAGNPSHNPFINQTATFLITGPGITASTTVSAATFSFGTMGETVVGNVSAVPEPSTIALALSGGLTLGVACLYRRRNRPVGQAELKAE